ncbi:hypothetical protein PIIN_11842 [Serendipita indica DSM 11827]|uniref:C2H2-type domain-containing protein n=1 Tax=Serendipita indica (strain DSM 11827) TaxID=1109443 RepID=G4TB64_SERID|nr:hypothetical protein PIIN_11842 [Serendipita indica DSM 11827]
MTTKQLLPPITRGVVALRDVATTKEQIAANGVGKRASPQDTPIFICELNACNRLFPSRDRLALHRKRDHNTDDVFTDVLTWNSESNPQDQMRE